MNLTDRVKKITDKLAELCSVIETVPSLELSSDKSKLRRKSPFVMKEIGPEFSIYVEGLSPQWDHGAVSKIFSSCGTVTHISLPRNKNTHQFRGFGFVEFDTGERMRDR